MCVTYRTKCWPFFTGSMLCLVTWRTEYWLVTHLGHSADPPTTTSSSDEGHSGCRRLQMLVASPAASRWVIHLRFPAVAIIAFLLQKWPQAIAGVVCVVLQRVFRTLFLRFVARMNKSIVFHGISLCVLIWFVWKYALRMHRYWKSAQSIESFAHLYS